MSMGGPAGNRLTFPGDARCCFECWSACRAWAAPSERRCPSPNCSSRTCARWLSTVLTPALSADEPSAPARWQRLLADAPATIRPLLQHLKDGTVHVELEIHDAEGVADRLRDGLLGSASLLAAARLLSQRTGPRIGPVSAPGALALAVGVLTWRRLVRSRAGCPNPLTRVRPLIRPIPQ